MMNDEATMVNRSSYGHFLICFNPTKPTGKFHFKIYMLCFAQTNLTLKMKIHTKDDSDVDANYLFDDMMNKLDTVTLKICKPLYYSSITVNMECVAVNQENQMIAVGWLDNKAVYFVSTADTTETVTVQIELAVQRWT
jgi:hypothetical protein